MIMMMMIMIIIIIIIIRSYETTDAVSPSHLI